MEDRHDEVTRRSRDERRAPRQRFVEHHPERVDVHAGVDVVVRCELLGRHVAGCAEDLPRAGQTREVERLADPEVHELHLDLVGARRRVDAGRRAHARGDALPRGGPRQEHIVGLEVAMDHVRPMRGREACHQTGDDRRQLTRVHLTFATHPLAQRLPLEQLHRDEDPAVVQPPERLDADDGRRVQLAEDLPLPAEARDGLSVEGDLRLEELQRDLLASREIGRAEHLRHAAAADVALDPEPPGDHRPWRCRRLTSPGTHRVPSSELRPRPSTRSRRDLHARTESHP